MMYKFFFVILFLDHLLEVNLYPNDVEKSENSTTNFGLTDEKKMNDFLEECSQLVDEDNFEDATSCYTEAIDEYPSEAFFYGKRGSCFIDAEKFRDALSDFKIAISKLKKTEMSSFNFDDLALLGKQLCSTKDFLDAMWCFDVAVKANPTAESPLKFRAECFSRMKRWDEAIADLEILVNMNPNEKKYHVSLGFALYELGRHKEAVDATIVSNDGKEIGELCAKLLFVSPNNLKEALRCLGKAIEKDPHNSKLFHFRGLCHIELEMVDEAIADCTEGLAIDPDNLSLRYFFIDILSSLKKKKEIEEELRFIPESELIRLGNKEKHYDGELALLVWNEAVRRNPFETSYYGTRGKLNARLNNLEMAASDFKECLKLDPNDEDYRILLVDVLLRSKKYDEAEAEVPRLRYLFLMHLGDQCMDQSRFEDAILCYSWTLLKIRKKWLSDQVNEIYKKLGYCYWKLEKFTEAIFNYEKSLEQSLNYDTLFEFCELLLEAKRYSKAREIFKKIELNLPDNASSLYIEKKRKLRDELNKIEKIQG